MIDEKGEAVIGATVLVKGTTNGTITDVDGIFTLDNVPSDALIAISYIGYQDRELSVKDKQSVNVTSSCCRFSFFLLDSRIILFRIVKVKSLSRISERTCSTGVFLK